MCWTFNKNFPVLKTLVTEVLKKRKNKNRRQKIENQSKFHVGKYKDPELIISEEYTSKYYIDENGIIGCLNPICPNCNSRKVTK